MEYKILTSISSEDLTKRISKQVEEGWKPIGGHQVQIKHQQNRFRGDQHIDTLNEFEYSQTLVKEN